MTEDFATEVANFSICGKTLEELLSQLEAQGQGADKSQEVAVQLAQELMRQGVVLTGSSGDKGEEAALAAQISRSLAEGQGVAMSGKRRKRLAEMVETAVEAMKTQTRSGAVVDHDGKTRAEGGAPSIKMGDEHSQKAARKTKTVRQKPRGGRGR